MTRKPLFLALSLFLALPATAEFCDLNLRYESGEVRWKAIVGAARYTVLETYGGLRPPLYYSTHNTFVTVDHRVDAPLTVRYIVTAEVDPGVRIQSTWSDACTGSIDVPVSVNPDFRKFNRRAVFPVVASVTGVFGAEFRTSAELRGAQNEHGKLIFHAEGKAASDSDPSIPYAFFTSRSIQLDDLLAAMGQHGVGWLEVVPDADSVDRIPEMRVRLFHDTPEGTFGTYETPVFPFDYESPAGMQVRIPDARFRVNAGICTLTETTVQAIIRRADGRLDGLRQLHFAAGWMQMTPINDFVGSVLQPGDEVVFSYSGSAVPFYTITENATHDPTLIVSPPEGTSRNLGPYVD